MNDNEKRNRSSSGFINTLSFSSKLEGSKTPAKFLYQARNETILITTASDFPYCQDIINLSKRNLVILERVVHLQDWCPQPIPDVQKRLQFILNTVISHKPP